MDPRLFNNRMIRQITDAAACSPAQEVARHMEELNRAKRRSLPWHAIRQASNELQRRQFSLRHIREQAEQFHAASGLASKMSSLPKILDVPPLAAATSRTRRDFLCKAATSQINTIQDVHKILPHYDRNLQDSVKKISEKHRRITAMAGQGAVQTAINIANHRVLENQRKFARAAKLLENSGLTSTLRQATELLSRSSVTGMMARTDIQSLIAQANTSIDTSKEDFEIYEDNTPSPPDWMLNLSREQLAYLCLVFGEAFNALAAVYSASLALSDGHISTEEITDLLILVGAAFIVAHTLLQQRGT